jgi:hypothetical protein
VGNARQRMATVMAEVSTLIEKSRLLGPTALSSHQRNTRRMSSALSRKRYECWDQHITYDEDIRIGRTEAGEEEYPVSVEEAQQVFLDALDDTISLLDLAVPTKIPVTTSLRQGADRSQSKGGNRGPKPISEEEARHVAEIVKRVAHDGSWRRKLDDVKFALDHGVCDASDPENCDHPNDHPKIPLPRGWKGKSCNWFRPPDDAALVKAIEERLKKARRNSNAETPS